MSSDLDLEKRLQAALAQACREAGLKDSDRSFVKAFLDREDEGWRDCCGSNCEPCALPLARAVDRVKELLADVS